MYPSYGGYEDYTGYLYHTAYVETDSLYLWVYWYIDGVQQSISGGPSTSAYFSPNASEFPGSYGGTTYTIEAVAYQYDPETNLMLSDSDSYTVIVYMPCLEETAAALTASIKSCSWNGRTASAEAKATVEHTGGKNAPNVAYVLTFAFEVNRVRANGNFISNVFTADLQGKQGTVHHGDDQVTGEYSDSFNLTGNWRQGETFEVYARVTAWAKNNKRGAEAEECVDDDYAYYTIPKN